MDDLYEIIVPSWSPACSTQQYALQLTDNRRVTMAEFKIELDPCLRRLKKAYIYFSVSLKSLVVDLSEPNPRLLQSL